ncbi:kinetochore-associated Ndc80 complex subunit spc25 [Basidiobolus ranarum]|uniref:Kinetochore protein SPC25 n=1 Tax=Basidiobolus ranarum TaxID=34480 RepID=A0ABR2VTP3_9FUNG
MSVNSKGNEDISSISLNSSETLNTSNNILPLNELYDSITGFIQQLDLLAEREIEKISETRKNWEKEVDEVEETNRRLDKELKHLENNDKKSTEKKVKEKRDITQLKSEISKLKKGQDEITSAIEELQLQIELKRDAITRKKEERAESLQALRSQRRKNQLKLNIYEDCTCMRIYGAQEDKITFIFTQIREDKPHREHAFTVDVSQGQYKVTECFPRLRDLDQIVKWVNQSGDFYKFLKKMRKSFSEYHKSRINAYNSHS